MKLPIELEPYTVKLVDEGSYFLLAIKGFDDWYGQFLIKTLWKSSMTMLESAKIFYSPIRTPHAVNHHIQFMVHITQLGKSQ